MTSCRFGDWTLHSSRVIARLKLPLHAYLGLDVFFMRIIFHLSVWKSQICCCCMKMQLCLCLSAFIVFAAPTSSAERGLACMSRAHLLFCTLTRTLLCNQTTQKSKGQLGEAEILVWRDLTLCWSLISLMAFFPALLRAAQEAYHVCGTYGGMCLGWQEASRPSYTLSSFLVSWHAVEICRNEPLVICSQPVASVQGENLF